MIDNPPVYASFVQNNFFQAMECYFFFFFFFATTPSPGGIVFKPK